MKHTLLIFLLLVISISVKSQTLEECLAKARENYPEIKRHDLIRQCRDFNVSNAMRCWLPQVTLSAQASWKNEVPEFPDAMNKMFESTGTRFDGFQNDQYHVALNVNQTIWDGGASSSSKKLAEAQAYAEQKQSDVALYALEERVEDIYFSILLLDNRAEQMQKSIELLESNLHKVEAMLKNGTAMSSDKDMISAELLTARQSLEQIKTTDVSYRRMLSHLIGCEIEGKLSRPENVEITSMQSARPELAMFSARRSMFDAERTKYNVAVRPRFSLFAECNYGYPGYDLFRSMQNSDWRFNTMLGVRMTWQLGSLYTRKNNMRKIEAEQQKIDVDREVFLFNTQLKTIAENEEITRLEKMIDSDSSILRLRQNVRKANESKYENGVTDINTLTRAINDETQASLARAAHEIQLLKAQYRLKRTLNR